MSITIRPAGTEDIPVLCLLEKECFSSPWSDAGFWEFFENGCSRCFCAEMDGRVCGYVGLYLMYGEAEITNLAVFSKYRRLGIGRALMDAVCHDNGVERVLLDVRESNAAARALYEACGFTVDGKRRGFYSHPREDAVLMSKAVTNN